MCTVHMCFLFLCLHSTYILKYDIQRSIGDAEHVICTFHCPLDYWALCVCVCVCVCTACVCDFQGHGSVFQVLALPWAHLSSLADAKPQVAPCRELFRVTMRDKAAFNRVCLSVILCLYSIRTIHSSASSPLHLGLTFQSFTWVFEDIKEMFWGFQEFEICLR